jgi:hypothetical protein
MADKPRTPAEKGQRMNMNPAILTKLLIRRNRYADESDKTRRQ